MIIEKPPSTNQQRFHKSVAIPQVPPGSKRDIPFQPFLSDFITFVSSSPKTKYGKRLKK
jgi:hypothetical protein